MSKTRRPLSQTNTLFSTQFFKLAGRATPYLVTAAVLATFAAPTSAEGTQPPLHCSIDASMAPHAFMSADGTLQGFQIDLFKEVARRMHREINIEPMAHAGEFPALFAGRIDFICGPMTVTKERAKNVIFTEPYLWTEWQFAIKKDSPSIKSEDDLKGKTIAVTKGIPQEKWLADKADSMNIKVLPFEGQSDAIQAVIQGRAYGYVNGTSSAKYLAMKIPQVKADWIVPGTRSAWATPFRKDNVKLRKEVEDAMVCMKKDGFIAKLSEKWFGVPPKDDDAEVTVFPGYGPVDFDGYDPTPQNPDCE